MPDKFVAVTQRLVSEHSIITYNNRILQAAALDQAVFKQVLNLLVITKRPSAGDIIAPGVRAHFDAEKLCESAVVSGTGAGDLEAIMRKRGHLRFAALQFDRGFELINIPLRILRHDARLLDHLAVLRGTTIGDGRLIGIELHQSVVDAEAGKRGEHMLHGVQFDAAFGKRGGTVCLRNILHRSLNLRLTIEVYPAKADAMIGGRGQKGHVDLIAAVQANAAKAGLAGQCLLVEHVGI